MTWKLDPNAGENILLRRLLIISAIIHTGVLLISVPRIFISTENIVAEEEWAIEADLLSDIPIPAVKGPLPLEDGKKDEEAADEKAAVAQPEPPLPDVASKAKPSPTKEEAVAVTPPAEKPVPPKPEEKKPEPPPVPVETPPEKPVKEEVAKEKPNDTVKDEAYKAELFGKLLKEQKQQVQQTKQEKLEEDKKRAVLADKIANLKKSLEGVKGGQGSPGAADYRQVITKFIQENYRIPDAYNYEGTVPPVVGFSLTAAGELQGLKIITSSNHAVLDHFVLQSMEDAAGFFPKPPRDWVGREINVRFLRQQ